MATEIRSLGDAVANFSAIAPVGDEVIVFRGHADYSWRMKTPISRAPDNLRAREAEMVRELIAVAPDAFSKDQSMFDRLVRMQHFGLPTRLLDMTSNPLVALFFAAEDTADNADGAVVVVRFERKQQQKYFDSDTVSCLANLANLSVEEKEVIESTTARTQREFNELNPVDRLVQFVRAEKPAFRPKIIRTDLFKRLHVIPKMSNPRIVAQSGSFILFGLRKDKSPTPFKLDRIRIASDCKANIRRDLERLGFTRSSLFPELDKAATQIVDRLAR